MNRKSESIGLSPRERQIAEAYANGASYREIADNLFIAPTTVRTHLSAIYRKLGVSSKIELLRVLESLEEDRESGVDTSRWKSAPDTVHGHAPTANPSQRFSAKQGAGQPGSEPAETQLSTMAILPFLVISEDKETRLIGAGLTEDLATLLARVPGFFVVSRDCSRTIDTKNMDAAHVGALLQVRYLVTGSIRGSRDHLRAITELIDAESEKTLWTQSFERTDHDDILDLQSDMAREITRFLYPELARAEFSRVERRPLESLDAWELYHRAQGLLVLKGLARNHLRQAFELLLQAVRIDPEFAIAHAQLAAIFAWCNVLKVDLGERDLFDKAMASVDQALELDRRNPTVLGFTGCALCDLRQNQRGLDLLRQAVDLDPSNAIAQTGLGAGLLANRENQEGISRLRQGIRLSPVDERVALWGTILARALYRIGQVDEAASEARQACRRSDTVAAPRVLLAVVEIARDNTEAAAVALGEAKRIEPDFDAEQMRSIVGRRGMDLLRKAGLVS